MLEGAFAAKLVYSRSIHERPSRLIVASCLLRRLHVARMSKLYMRSGHLCAEANTAVYDGSKTPDLLSLK